MFAGRGGLLEFLLKWPPPSQRVLHGVVQKDSAFSVHCVGKSGKDYLFLGIGGQNLFSVLSAIFFWISSLPKKSALPRYGKHTPDIWYRLLLCSGVREREREEEEERGGEAEKIKKFSLFPVPKAKFSLSLSFPMPLAWPGHGPSLLLPFIYPLSSFSLLCFAS